jgi:hypothetical protein
VEKLSLINHWRLLRFCQDESVLLQVCIRTQIRGFESHWIVVGWDLNDRQGGSPEQPIPGSPSWTPTIPGVNRDRPNWSESKSVERRAYPGRRLHHLHILSEPALASGLSCQEFRRLVNTRLLDCGRFRIRLYECPFQIQWLDVRDLPCFGAPRV